MYIALSFGVTVEFSQDKKNHLRLPDNNFRTFVLTSVDKSIYKKCFKQNECYCILLSYII